MSIEIQRQKARGAFFTPPAISHFLVEWAVRRRSDRVLEPSCGDAAFLVPAAERLRDLGVSRRNIPNQLQGVEIHKASVEEAEERLDEEGLSATIVHSDFFDCEPRPVFDAVVGNPPFIRYQSFSGEARAKSLRAALAHGVRLTALASSWAAFVIHASEFLNENGRLGMVLPAELLSVNYAAEVRRFLLNRFANVRLVLFDNLVFPGVTAEVVLLLAEGRGTAKSFEVIQLRDLAALADLNGPGSLDFLPSGGEKWTPALISSDALKVYRDLTRERAFSRLVDWGETYLGNVTGNNGYFTLTAEQVGKLKLGPEDLLKISPPGSRHLRGLTFTAKAWREMANRGARSYLFAPQGDVLSPAARAYVTDGERKEVQKAYKCSNRTPWWRVPQVEKPDILFSYMNHDHPRLIANDAGISILNSLYGLKLRDQLRDVGKSLLPIACLNSLTLLGSEVVGRAYGGGLLKHEPREADLLPTPSAEALDEIGGQLALLKPQLAIALRSNDLSAAVRLVDSVVLTKHMRITEHELQGLRRARELLFNRRVSRAVSARVSD
ncbi:N-6 DNA methylase [Bradyrhizobium sp. RP6]|uniref:N-6 DNA methylase n=1 Tax=Bradyrhizobium sp. RP6 TaxID=2489596 RepID=UPI000F5430F8|nr:N-6 DNA methylase [Bradyrhizobium sp. RP6]RQH08697.1 SAM-dependent DNA methyltransferase [Bradyrhizobium sp. RP6]